MTRMQKGLSPLLSRLGRFSPRSDKHVLKNVGYVSPGRHSSGVANVGKSPGTTNDHPSQKSGFIRRGGALALSLALGLVGYRAVDDLVIYHQCSSIALEKASQSPKLKKILGEEIQRAPWHWYQASLAVGHEGHSASCSFPVSGSQGTGSLHLKAVRFQDETNGLLSRVVEGGEWDVLMLEARIFGSGNDNPIRNTQRINLMQESDDLKAGDFIGGDGSPCMSSSLHEI